MSAIKFENEDAFEKPFTGEAPDYSDRSLWLAFPEERPYDVDLIYLYPSACMDPESPVICDIDNESMIQGAKDYFTQQSPMFEGIVNIFAPYWRQVNGVLLSTMSFEAVDEAEWAEPRTDVFAALDYYFQNENDGRPFFIAGHSQGSRLLGMALGEYMKVHPEYYSRMICAYRVGDAMTKDYLAKYPHVIPARAADDLGVCASWNTEGEENVGHPSLVIAPGAIAINPLNWKADETPAGEELCLGCQFLVPLTADVKDIPEKTGAVLNLERGSVIVTNPEMKKYSITECQGEMGKFMIPMFGPCSYHNCDYSFFHNNVRENVKTRIKAWFEQAEAI